MVDGAKGPPHDDVAGLVFSPDGKRVAYAALDDGKWRVLVDGEAQKPYDTLGDDSLLFSPDGAKFAYAARSAGKWCVVVGQEQKHYDGVGQLCWSPNGQHLAYGVQTGEFEMVVLDGREGRIFDAVAAGSLVFSPNSDHLGYIAGSRTVRFAVVDNNRKPRFDAVGYLNFSPDGQSTVYAAIAGGKAFTVVEDKPALHQYDAIWLAHGRKLPFDSRKQFHYMAVKEDGVYLVEEVVD